MTKTSPGCFFVQQIVLPCLLVSLISVNIGLVIREFYNSDQTRDRVIRHDYIIQKIVAFVPFSITVIYCLVYEMSNRKASVHQCFRDFFTFMGFPLTALHFTNLVFHSLKDLITHANRYSLVIFPVVLDKIAIGACFRLETLVIVINFITLLVMMYFYDCLSKFKPFLPVFMFSLLFCGVLLDRFAVIDHSQVSNDDWKFIASLTVQILIVDAILIALSYFGNRRCSETAHQQSENQSEDESENDFDFFYINESGSVDSMTFDQENEKEEVCNVAQLVQSGLKAENNQIGRIIEDGELANEEKGKDSKQWKSSLLQYITIDKEYNKLNNQI